MQWRTGQRRRHVTTIVGRSLRTIYKLFRDTFRLTQIWEHFTIIMGPPGTLPGEDQTGLYSEGLSYDLGQERTPVGSPPIPDKDFFSWVVSRLYVTTTTTRNLLLPLPLTKVDTWCRTAVPPEFVSPPSMGGPVARVGGEGRSFRQVSVGQEGSSPFKDIIWSTRSPSLVPSPVLSNPRCDSTFS